MLIGCMRASKADGSRVPGLRRDALPGACSPAGRFCGDHASGKRDDWPGLEACLQARLWDDAQPAPIQGKAAGRA